jgi:hypothetical protein
LSKPFRFGRLQPRTSASADARQRARSLCFHSSKRPQKKASKTTSAALVDDVTAATQEAVGRRKMKHISRRQLGMGRTVGTARKGVTKEASLYLVVSGLAGNSSDGQPPVSVGLTFQFRRLRCFQSCSACTSDNICAIKLHLRHSRSWCRSWSLSRAPSCCDMVSSIDGLAGAAAVSASGAAAASRSRVGGGNRGLGANMSSTLRRTSRQARRRKSRLTHSASVALRQSLVAKGP